MTLIHATADAPPPARRDIVLDWISKSPNNEQVGVERIRLPPGWEVPEEFRDYYWSGYRIHREYADRCHTNRWQMESQFLIRGKDQEFLGCGQYTSEDPADRALSDCAILQIEWEFRGQDFFPKSQINTNPVYMPVEFGDAIEDARRMAKERKEDVEKFMAQLGPMPPYPGPRRKAPAVALPVSAEMREVICTNPGNVRLVVGSEDGTTRIERIRMTELAPIAGQFLWCGQHFDERRFEVEEELAK